MEPILACPGVPREVNRPKLAALAVSTGHHIQDEETFYSGIFSLPPGASITVEQTGLRQQRYWEPRLGRGPYIPKDPKEAFAALREVIVQAVECRLDRDHPVAILLSGGLDSSAIVSVAARCLQRQNRELTAVSAVLPDESLARFADERSYIDEFRSWPNIRIKYVTAAGRGPFDSLGDLNRFAVFFLRSSRFYLDEECAKAAIASGARSILWGSGGELGVTSWSERYYLELAIRLRWPTLFRELKKRRTGRNSSAIRTLARQLVGTMLPRRGWKPVVFLSAEFQRECRARPAWNNHSIYQRPHQVALLRHWLSRHAMERGQTVSLLPSCSPLLDKRILEFCLAMPASMDVRDGYQRFPIRAALDGILPKRIQWRTDKMAYSPDYFVRYNAQLGIAREFVAEIGPHDPVRTIVDVDRVRELLVPVDPRNGAPEARDQIPCTLYMINFLRQFSAFRH